MHKHIAIISIFVLLLSGCSEIAAQQKDNEILTELGTNLEREIFLYGFVSDFDRNSASISSINNVQAKINEFDLIKKDIVKNLNDLSKSKKSQELNDKVMKYLEIEEQSFTLFTEYYDYQKHLIETSALYENDVREVLDSNVYYCRCREVDCDSQFSTLLEFFDLTIEKYGEIGQRFKLKFSQDTAELINEEKAIYERFLPGLIKKSKKLTAARCTDLESDYNKYLNEYDKLKFPTDDVVNEELSAKWFIPSDNLFLDSENALSQAEDTRLGMMG